jgi:hypothetical protein
MQATCTTVSNLAPGLGFQHLSTVAANMGSGGTRGAPRGEPAESASACCSLCNSHGAACAAWFFRAGKCFPGSCSADGLPCFERLRGPDQTPLPGTAGVRSDSPISTSPLPPVTLCGRAAASEQSYSGRRAEVVAAAGARGRASAATGLALLLLGHRGRLMFGTVPSNVIRPAVTAGTPVDVFAFLENSTMARAFRGRRPQGSPELTALDDDGLVRRLAADVRAAGGRVATIHLGQRPAVSIPQAHPSRLSRYSDGVKTTVATRFAKEGLGLRMVLDYERTRPTRYEWLLWTREDSHWFAPLDLSRFERGAVHGKACGGFGGWNDKVWLMDREWAPHMLSMYDAFHTRYDARCADLRYGDADVSLPPAPIGGELHRHGTRGGLVSDFLAAPSVEQFRERVGKLHR